MNPLSFEAGEPIGYTISDKLVSAYMDLIDQGYPLDEEEETDNYIWFEANAVSVFLNGEPARTYAPPVQK